MEKKLTKSFDKKISGVCGGIAEYLNMDPTVIRVAYACLTAFTTGFPGIVLYIILAIIMPDPNVMNNQQIRKDFKYECRKHQVSNA